MPVGKFRASSIPDASMKPEPKSGKHDKDGRESLDNIIRQAIGNEPFLSFSRAGENPVQWIQFLHALDQQGTNKLSKGSKVDSGVEGRDRLLKHCNGVSPLVSELNSVKESVPSIKDTGDLSKSSKSPPEHIQPLKIPEAVVAFAQAAAKVNGGEPEKYLSGWPLPSPSKVQMQKCDKCSHEFCSPINYRRHIRVHRRSLNIDKDSHKNREYLAQFWDKLSLDEAREIISFKNVALEEVAGSSIIRALASFIRKPGLSTLPQIYIKAGAALLDVVQTRPPRFPISSKELFLILDDASESTFLCAGTAVSMHKFVFDGEAGKIGLEMKNLVACTSFLVEQKLVKAWLADKDAEALRCQKLLVEEEEAAQKRQAELLERKRLKKLRQKEQKAKEQADGDKADFKEASPDDAGGASFLAEASSARDSFESDPNNLELSTNFVQPSVGLAPSLDTDVEANIGFWLESRNADVDMACLNAELGNCQNVDAQPQRVVRRQVVVSRRPKLPRNTANGFHMGLAPLPKLISGQKHNGHWDQRVASLANGHKVWTRKTKPEGEREDLSERVQRETRDQPVQNENCEVLIGSICVMLGDCNGQVRDGFQADSDHQLMRGNNISEKLAKPDSGQNGGNRLTVKLWRPVGVLSNSWHGGGGSAMVQSERKEVEIDGDSGKAADCVPAGENCLTQGAVGAADSSVGCKDSQMVESKVMDQMGLRLFSNRAAEHFLAQRWKEVMAADHVKLVLSEPSDVLTIFDSRHLASGPLLDSGGRSVLGNAENRLAGAGLLEPATTEASKSVFRVKPEKGSRLKYIPKQRNMA